MYRSDEEFSNWYDYKATPDERELAEKVEEFGELFKDMLFKKGTCTFDMIKEIDLQGGKQAMSTQEEIECFEYYHYYYSVEPLEDCDAYYNHGELTLCVLPEALNEDSTILHEMIHLHEALINDLPLYYHDMIIWALYKSLKERIPAYYRPCISADRNETLCQRRPA